MLSPRLAWLTGLIVLSLSWPAATLAAGLGGTKHDFTKNNPNNPFKNAKNACEPCHQYLKLSLPTKIGGVEVRLRSTAVCLSCHADSKTPEVSKKITCTFANAQHPVDVALPTTADFEPPAKMPQLVFYGKDRLMGCTTCHDTHNGKGLPYFLRMQNDEDALCRTCHNQ